MWNFLNEDQEMSDEAFQEAWDKAEELMIQTASTGDLQKMLRLASLFPKDTSLYWDLDTTYRVIFEEMPNYPPPELYEDTSNSEVLHNLRIRTYNSKMFSNNSKTPVLNEEMVLSLEKLYNLEPDFFPYERINELNNHEARLLLEAYFNSISGTDIKDADTFLLEKLILQLGNA